MIHIEILINVIIIFLSDAMSNHMLTLICHYQPIVLTTRIFHIICYEYIFGAHFEKKFDQSDGCIAFSFFLSYQLLEQ